MSNIFIAILAWLFLGLAFTVALAVAVLICLPFVLIAEKLWRD